MNLHELVSVMPSSVYDHRRSLRTSWSDARRQARGREYESEYRDRRITHPYLHSTSTFGQGIGAWRRFSLSKKGNGVQRIAGLAAWDCFQYKKAYSGNAEAR